MTSMRTSSLVLAVLMLAACSADLGGVGAATPAVASPHEPLVPALGAISDERDGIAVSVELSSHTVKPGGSVDMTVRVRNDRAEPAIVGFRMCGAGASVYGDVPVPWNPTGRDWDGIQGEFKRFALQNGTQPGIVHASLPTRVEATGDSCPVWEGAPDAGIAIGPGETNAGRLTWTADITPGIPAMPGLVPIHVDVAYDPPPLPTPNCDQICGLLQYSWPSFSADGTLEVSDGGQRILTAGEAIDELLSDAEFAAWLTEQPPQTWSALNVFLTNWNVDGTVVPRGPAWDIELFREMGVARNFAMGFVDPYNGEVKHVDYCNDPCDR